MPRTFPLVFALACQGEQGFSNAKDDDKGDAGTAVIAVTPTEITFSDMDWEGKVSQSEPFKVTNEGVDGNLQLYDVGIVDSGGGVFYMEEFAEAKLAPGASAEFTVVATLTAFEAIDGEARIVSNDKDAHEFRIPLHAIPAGWTGDTGE